jgi:site-specific DNA recombinase
MADEMEREKARQRMVDTMARKARAGHVTGGQCFGYDNVPVVEASGVRSHVEQRINDGEAAIVRRIFELAAAGQGLNPIAKMLNAERASAPRSQQDRPRAWVQSSVHSVLHRRRYVGEIVWHQTRKRDRWGQRHQTDRDQSEWITVPAPHLRIISDELWAAAHRQIEARRLCTNIKAREKDSKYLLPGLARCAWCNGGLHVRKRTRNNGHHLYSYACTSHFNRGESVCGNVVQFSMAEIGTAVIRRIANILTPTLVDEVLARVRELLAPDHQAHLRDRVAAQLEEAEQQAANLAEAIALGGDVPALVARLQTADQTRQELAQQLRALGDGPIGSPPRRLARCGPPGEASAVRLARVADPTSFRGEASTP